MVKSSKRKILTLEEKAYKALQALFILQARQLNIGNKDMQKILGVDKADINAVAKVINQSLNKLRKEQQKNK